MLTGRFVLVDDHEIVGGGIISMDGYPDQRRASASKPANLSRASTGCAPEDRARRTATAAAILWFTGLSGAGKSTLAFELEQRLFAQGLP